jgi:hypothetical protein
VERRSFDLLSSFPTPPNRVGQETNFDSDHHPILLGSNLTVYSNLISESEVRIREVSSYRLRNDLRKSDRGESEIQRELTEFETYLDFAILLELTL